MAARDSKRRAVLLSVIGPSTYSLLRNLVSPAKPAEKTYEDLVVVLKEHYAPTPSVPVQRFKFKARLRKAGESVADYVSELRKLTEHCDFRNGLNERLRDQFVSGIGDEKLQKKLLAKENLTFEKAYKTALADEIAMRDAGVFVPTPAVRETTSVNKIRATTTQQRKPTPNKGKPSQKFPHSTKKQRQCYRCGRPDHLAPDCPMKEKKCNFCHKIGHLSNVCFAKKKSETVHNVCENDDEYETCVFSVSNQTQNDKPIMRKLHLQGCEMLLQVIHL